MKKNKEGVRDRELCGCVCVHVITILNRENRESFTETE